MSMGDYELDWRERDALYTLINLAAHCTYPGCEAKAEPEEAVWHSGGPDAPPVADLYWKDLKCPGWQLFPENGIVRCPDHRYPVCSICRTVWEKPLGEPTERDWVCMDCRAERATTRPAQE